MAQDNLRVYDLAKELKISNKDLIEKINDKLGLKIKSHSSVITEAQANKIRQMISDEQSGIVKKPKAFVVKKTKIEREETAAPTKKVPLDEAPAVKVIKRPEIKVIKKPEPQPLPEKKEIKKVKEETPTKPVEQQKTETTPKQDTQEVQLRPPRPKDMTGGIKVIKRPKPVPIEPKKQEPSTIKEKEVKKPATEGRTPIKRTIITQDMYENKGVGKKKGKTKDKERYKNKEYEQERISLEKAAAQKHKKKARKEENEKEITSIVLTEAITVGELATKIQKAPSEIVKYLMMEGILATVNQVINLETAKKAVESFGVEVLNEDLDSFMEQELEKEEKAKALTEVDEKLLKKRAPVVSIMGHVDHGKTTLLDSIRAAKHKIVSTEVGGITQSIGAYTVYLDNDKDKKIVFIDTPGHAAFTEMRARGAKATDIAILVVAADDGIMPQTIEAISHAKAAEVPIIVAVNKIDKPEANPDRILQQLTEHNLVPEAWGGDTITQNVSALQGTGIDELLEYILLLSEVQDLKANPSAKASGVIIEANLDKGKGAVATLLVQNGTLSTGDSIVVGTVGGKVRALLSDSGERVKKAGPSTPVEVLGLSEVPKAGEFFEVVSSEKEMKAIIQKRKENERTSRLETMKPALIHNEIVGSDEDAIPRLNLIIKANTNGAAEAVAQSVRQLESKEIITKIVHVGVGDVSEADVMLASASNSIILGFAVREDMNAQAAAERENITIKKYNIIYQVLEDLEQTMLNLLKPEIKEIEMGRAEVRQIFTIGKNAKIAGCYVTEGKALRGKIAIVERNGAEIFRGTVDQLKRFKDDVKEVAQGFECGISFAKFNEIEEGDVIRILTTVEVEKVSLS